MAATHGIVSGMGGMRAAGDLVARMQVTRAMRVNEAKDYVAGRLGISVKELADPVMMSEIREDLHLGMINPQPGCALGVEAKFRIAELLGIEINCLSRFRSKAGAC
jgi:dimethylamine--corrinoid protein Co-methyltransferase